MAVATKPKKARKPAPPKPTARKDNPVNAEYEKRAKELLRYAMSLKSMTPEQLSQRLGTIGVEISAGGVANKISRGGFSSAFLIQCMEAMDINLAALPR